MLRARIVDAACQVLAEEGIDALSIRAIAERVEYSPATIYLYFRGKDDLVRAVLERMVGVLSRYFREALSALPSSADGRAMHRALARAYVLFAIENTSFFRLMFELPGVPRLMAEWAPEPEGVALSEERPFAVAVAVLKRAEAEGHYAIPGGAKEGALVAWSLVQGLVTLYLSGHFGDSVPDRDALMTMLERSLDSLYEGWRPR